jgi:hypothetical protein
MNYRMQDLPRLAWQYPVDILTSKRHVIFSDFHGVPQGPQDLLCSAVFSHAPEVLTGISAATWGEAYILSGMIFTQISGDVPQTRSELASYLMLSLGDSPQVTHVSPQYPTIIPLHSLQYTIMSPF